MTFSRKILVGLALGILVGLFFGEQALALKWAADGFVKLLQMTVLPYVTVSIIESLGSLGAADARRLGVRAGAVLVALWAVALTFAMLVPLTFPIDRDGDVLQHDAPRTPAALRLRRSLHPGESVLLTGEQHRAGGRPLLDRPGVGRHRPRAQAGPPRPAARGQRRAVARHPLHRPAHALRALRHRRDRRRHAEPRAARPPAGVPHRLRQRGAARQPVGAAGSRRRADADPDAGHLFTQPQRAHHGVRGRRSLHRAPGAHRVEPHARRAGGRRARQPAGGHRSRVVQLSPHGEAAVDQLHPVCRVVCRCRRAARGVSAAGVHGPGDVLRQPQRRRAVPARSLPHPGRHVSAVPGERRDQLTVRHAGGGHAHAGGRAPRNLRDDRRAAVGTPAGRALPHDHRHPDGGCDRRRAPLLRSRLST